MNKPCEHLRYTKAGDTFICCACNAKFNSYDALFVASGIIQRQAQHAGSWKGHNIKWRKNKGKVKQW